MTLLIAAHDYTMIRGSTKNPRFWGGLSEHLVRGVAAGLELTQKHELKPELKPEWKPE